MFLKISHQSRNALIRGLLAGVITTTAYLLIVIITTPNLPPLDALNASIRLNYLIIFGLAIGVGAQIYLSGYSKNMGCTINKKKEGLVGSSGGTVISSFLSFFSLVPLGCCGTWLLFLSLLPSVFGTTFSVILIQYSKPLSYLGLTMVLGLTLLSAVRLRKDIKKRNLTCGPKQNRVLSDINEVKEYSFRLDQN